MANITLGSGNQSFQFEVGSGDNTVVDFRSRYFHADLSGANEVPPRDTTATGTADAVLNFAQTKLDIDVDVTGLSTNAISGHIHHGVAGVNGGVVFSLTPPSAQAFSISRSWDIPITEVDDLLSKGLYVNIHTDKFTGGEIRGQLEANLGDTGNDRIDLTDFNVGTFEALLHVLSDTVQGADITIRKNGVADVLTLGGIEVADLEESFFIFAGNVNETINGTAGIDDLFGAGGTDVINGLGGNDHLLGETGNDTLVGGAGADHLHGGSGVDTASYAGSNAAVNVNMWTETYTGGHAAGDELFSIENLTGSSHNDILVANDVNNVLNGAAGADSMKGLAGDDTYFVDNAGDVILEDAGDLADIVATNTNYVLTAGAEVETLRTTSMGGTGAINLTGNAFSQTIVGNAGINVLKGGGGLDTLSGLGGNDIYLVYNATDVIQESSTQGAVDRIATAVSYVLKAGVHVEQMTTTSAAGTGAINLTGNEIGQMMTGNAGTNRLEGKGGADQYRGLGGADTFVFATALGGGNVDKILDFSVPDDRMLLSDAIFTALNTGTLASAAFRSNTTGLAGDASDRIIYENDTGRIFYDADGTGATAGIHFVTITAGLALTNADFSVA
ncbi:CHRD domain-containing protein [Mesorhizobium sp. IMUNJ 23232]|uniref:CHRD domain-containing protein n=1 Tax=Mesorhizobium sp. IMUNJ 23232 TaxID=3376064 RepID=UPI0037AE878E